MDKELQADIDRLKIASFPDDMIAWNASLDRIIARIPEPLLKEGCVFKNCEFYNEDFDGHCNCEYCGGSAQEQCVWYVYLQKDRKIRKPNPAPDFDAIAQEIETGAFDCFSWNDEVMVKRPETCDTCPFGSDDADEGPMCCGHPRDTYTEIDAKGGRWTSVVEAPKDALEHKCECMFVKED